MNNRPHEQVFSSELIYQTVNAVRLFDEQVYGLKEQLLTRLNKTGLVEGQKFSISNFYFVQRRWANCTLDSRHPLTPWFDYSFYAVDSFDNLKVEALINSFNETEKWEYLFKYIDIHYPRKPKIISEAIEWINNNKPRLAELVKASDPRSRPKLTEFSESDRRLLHHHLLQLYSRFPTRNYIHGGLYRDFIEKYSFGEAQPARAYYVYLLKYVNEPYPPYQVWELERGVKPKGHGSPQREDKEDIGTTADLIRPAAVDFFTKYLAPIFIEPEFDGRGEFDLNKGSIDHMLWLPLYDECIDGRFHGFFRGWLFQVVSENIEGSSNIEANPLFNGNIRLMRKRRRALVEYTSSCLNLSQSLVSDINRAIMREMLNQGTFRENSYDVLTNNLCLMGDWHNPITRRLTEMNKNTFKELGGIDERGRPTTLSINLDAPFLERESDTYVSFDEINEDPGEKHRELLLEFGPDFRHPEKDRDDCYDRLINHIYLIFTRLKNAKWAEILSQSYERNRLSNSLAHGLKNSFSVVVNLIEDNVTPVKELSPTFLYFKDELSEKLERIVERIIKYGVEREKITLGTLLGLYELEQKGIEAFIDSSKRAKLITEFASETFRRIEAIYDKIDADTHGTGRFGNKGIETAPLSQVILRAFATAIIIAFTRSQPGKWEQEESRKTGTPEINAYGKPPTRPVLIYNSRPYALQITDFEELVNNGESFKAVPGVTLLQTSIDEYSEDPLLSNVKGLISNQYVHKPYVLAYVLEELFFNCLKNLLIRDESYGTVAIYLDVEEGDYTSFSIRCRLNHDTNRTEDNIIDDMRIKSRAKGGLASCNQFLSKYEFKADGSYPLRIDKVHLYGKSYVQYKFCIKMGMVAEREQF